MSTRVIGGVIMTHGDDDGLRLPPAIAPRQIVLVPMLRGDERDDAILGYCDVIAGRLNQANAFHLPLRAYVDKKQVPSAEKRWNWVRRGAPLILEIGQRDVAASKVTFMRRDALRSGEKVASHTEPRDTFIARAPDLLAAIQSALYDEAKQRSPPTFSMVWSASSRWPTISAPPSRTTKAIPASRAGCGCPGASPPAPRSMRSTSG